MSAVALQESVSEEVGASSQAKEAPAAIEITGQRVGRLVAAEVGQKSGVRVDYCGNPHGPLRARSLVPQNQLEAALERGEGLQVVLGFEQALSDKPVVIGLLQEPESRPAQRSEQRPDDSEISVVFKDAVVDGRRVRIEASEEIELSCGQASITLRRNGRIVVRGAYVETRARGTNRIRGGTVAIN